MNLQGVLRREMNAGTVSSGYWIRNTCSRCEGSFFVWSEQGQNGFSKNRYKCFWCRGDCSAAEQEHLNARIEEESDRKPFSGGV